MHFGYSPEEGSNQYKVLNILSLVPKEIYSYLEVEPKRPHTSDPGSYEISGVSVVSDPLYAGRKQYPDRAICPRMFLHATIWKFPAKVLFLLIELQKVLD